MHIDTFNVPRSQAQMHTLEGKFHSTYTLLHNSAELLSYSTVYDLVVLIAGQSADIPLNWGAEGQEGPVLATGVTFSRHFYLVMRLCTSYAASPIHSQVSVC